MICGERLCRAGDRGRFRPRSGACSATKSDASDRVLRLIMACGSGASCAASYGARARQLRRHSCAKRKAKRGHSEMAVARRILGLRASVARRFHRSASASRTRRCRFTTTSAIASPIAVRSRHPCFSATVYLAHANWLLGEVGRARELMKRLSARAGAIGSRSDADRHLLLQGACSKHFAAMPKRPGERPKKSLQPRASSMDSRHFLALGSVVPWLGLRPARRHLRRHDRAARRP